ncbi:MAG: tRNA (adenosine(37)-N6)-threonylcarbamoyltransferase complex dimerization subunit type 1 TsaB [Cyclobacteriaceae bacterium]
MALLLSLETSTAVCSAALHEQGHLLAFRILHTPQSAASQLAVQVNELFEETGMKPTSLHGVAISAGPGSYTGLRIGAATAKGLCYGTGIPLIAIDSLRVLSAAIPERQPDIYYCPMIDARRMEVYCSVLDYQLQEIETIQAKVIDANSFADLLNQHRVVFFGDGASKCRETIQHPNATFLNNIYGSAQHMGALTFSRYAAKQFVSVGDFEPNYLKDFVAKTKSPAGML